jgi:hypothetical protein
LLKRLGGVRIRALVQAQATEVELSIDSITPTRGDTDSHRSVRTLSFFPSRGNLLWNVLDVGHGLGLAPANQKNNEERNRNLHTKANRKRAKHTVGLGILARLPSRSETAVS